MEFDLKQDGNQGAYVAVKENKTIAEITWAQLGDVMVIDHTFVDASLRGQGIAKKLLDKAADYARQKNFKIEPVCSYVVSVFEHTTSYDDIKVSKV